MEDDWEEGDNFLFCNLDSSREEGVWGEFGFEEGCWGILTNWILSKDLMASSWLMFRDDMLGLRFKLISLVWVVGF